MDWVSSALIWYPKWPGLTLLDHPPWKYINNIIYNETILDFWTLNMASNSGRGYAQKHMTGDGAVLTCEATKGTHIEMSWTPLTYSKRVRTYTLLNCSCFLCKIFSPYVNFSFILHLSHTPSIVLLPFSSEHLAPQHEPRTRLSSDNETVTATKKILTNEAAYACAKKNIHLTPFKNPVSTSQ